MEEAKPAIFDGSVFYDKEQPEDCKDYIMQQTCFRIKDPEVTLKFYVEILGMNLIYMDNFEKWGFSNYFVGYCDKSKIPKDQTERRKFAFATPGCIELTWNHGTEKEEGRVYNIGNADTTGTQDGQKVRGGFGHIGITVDDVYATCQKFHDQGVQFHKSPNQGGMKGLAFVKDPDGYLVEVLPKGDFVKQEVDCLGVRLDAGGTYKDNSK